MNLLTHISGCYKSEIQVSEGLVPLERENLFQACPLTSGGLLAIFGIPWLVDFCPHLLIAFCIHVYVHVRHISSFFRDNHIGLQAHSNPE